MEIDGFHRAHVLDCAAIATAEKMHCESQLRRSKRIFLQLQRNVSAIEHMGDQSTTESIYVPQVSV